MHAVERSDRVAAGGVFVSSPAFKRDDVALKLKDVEIDPSQRRPRRAVELLQRGQRRSIVVLRDHVRRVGQETAALVGLGPTPQWIRVTQYVVDRDGNRVESTPHQVDVRSGALSGHATFAWTGCADPECEAIRRYQLVDVTLDP